MECTQGSIFPPSTAKSSVVQAWKQYWDGLRTLWLGVHGHEITKIDNRTGLYMLYIYVRLICSVGPSSKFTFRK